MSVGGYTMANKQARTNEEHKAGFSIMKIHPVDPRVRQFWKIFPLRIPGGSVCDQCGQETVLVQSMKGGFVTRNCPTCNIPTTLPTSVFKRLHLWIACPKCGGRMEDQIVTAKNYGYICRPCDIGIPLFALLPRWEELQPAQTRKKRKKRAT